MNAQSDTWPLKTLAEIATLKMGGTPSTESSEYWLDGDVLWATPSDLGRGEIVRLKDTARKITTAGLNAKRMDTFPCGTVLLSTTATIGNIGIADRPTYCNQQITALIPNEAILSEYLAYYLLRSKADLMRLGGTSTATHINQKNLSTLNVPVPSISEQLRIVDILSRAEGIVRLRREAQKKAAEIIPALFIDMFGDPATNPKGWEISRLRNITQDVKNGFNPTKEQFGPGTPFITVNSLYNGLKIDLSASQTVTIDSATFAKYRLYRGDICFVRSSVKRAGVGIPSVFDSDNDAIFGGFVIRIRIKDDIDPLFLCAQFHTPSMRHIVVESAGTGTITNVNQPSLLGLPVIIPPLSIQQDFAHQAEQVEAIQIQQSAATEKAQATFGALLAQAFIGSLT